MESEVMMVGEEGKKKVRSKSEGMREDDRKEVFFNTINLGFIQYRIRGKSHCTEVCGNCTEYSHVYSHHQKSSSSSGGGNESEAVE